MVKKSFTLENILVFLIAISPSLMYTGRSLFNIVLPLILITFIITYKSNIDFFNHDALLKAIALFLVALPFVSFLSTASISWEYLANAFAVIIFLFILQTVFFKTTHHQKNRTLFLKILFYSVSLLAIVLTISYLINIDLFLSIKKLHITPFDHAVFHSKQTFLIAGLGLYLYYFIKEKKSFLNIICLAAIIISAFASFGRTAIITMIVGLLVFSYIYYLQNSKTIVKVFVIGLLILASLFPIAYISTGDSFDVTKIHTSGRFDGYQKYIDYTLQHAPILGLGVDGSKMLFDKRIIPHKHPHNIVVEVFVATGLIGVIFLITVVSYILFLIGKAYIKAQETIAKALIASSFSMFMISSQGFWSLWNRSHLMIMLLYLFFSFFILKSSIVSRKT